MAVGCKAREGLKQYRQSSAEQGNREQAIRIAPAFFQRASWLMQRKIYKREVKMQKAENLPNEDKNDFGTKIKV